MQGFIQFIVRVYKCELSSKEVHLPGYGYTELLKCPNCKKTIDDVPTQEMKEDVHKIIVHRITTGTFLDIASKLVNNEGESS